MSVKVLAVDDSALMRKLFTQLFEKEGFTVQVARNGEEALSKAVEFKPDCITLDINMPVMDGITFTRELRKLNHCRFIPVLVLTTESASEMKMQGKNAGATGWIVKPFNPDSLNRVLDRVLDPGRS